MAQFFKPQKKSTQPQRIEFTVDSLDHHCVGVGRHQGKAIFVEGALPGEAIKARIIDDKKHYAHAALQQVVTPAANRVAPFCDHYRECGGCSAQHLGEGDQLAAKEAGLVSLFERLGNIQAPALAPALTGSPAPTAGSAVWPSSLTRTVAAPGWAFAVASLTIW